MKVDWDVKTNLRILEIEASTLEDSGEYTVKATNDAGSSQATFTVSVTAVVKEVPKEEKLEEKEEAVTEEEIVEVVEVAETCVVTEKAAEAVSDIPAPTFKVAPKPVTVTEGGVIKLACKVERECI